MAAVSPDPKYSVVTESITKFEVDQDFKVADDARSYLLDEILIGPAEFTVAVQDQRIDLGRVQNAIYSSLIRGKELSLDRCLPDINREIIYLATHEVIEVQMGCEWPFIIC